MNSEYKDLFIKIGLKVSYYRKAKSLTQKHLAELLDYDVSFISQIEVPNVYKLISLKTLFRIAGVLGVSAYKFLYFDN